MEPRVDNDERAMPHSPGSIERTTETMKRNAKTDMRAVQARNENGNERLTEVKEAESASDGQAEEVTTCFESFDDMQLAEVSSE
jgi:hypothetical protein